MSTKGPLDGLRIVDLTEDDAALAMLMRERGLR